MPEDSLEDAILALLSGEKPKDIPLVAELVRREGCKGYQCGNPYDGMEYDCPYSEIGDCEECPINDEEKT